MFFFWKRDRRYERRYHVSWDAVLEVCFPDFQGQMPVKVTNFSHIGALLQADQIYLKHRHLIDANQRPELKLKVLLPEGVFETKINICWYSWSVEKIAFEIGIQFADMLKEERLHFMDKIIDRLYNQHKQIAIS